MTYKEFAQLDYLDKSALIKNHAVQVGYHEDKHHHYYLLQLESFYLEIKKTAETEAIDVITCFDDTRLLDIYIKDIDVTCLVE